MNTLQMASQLQGEYREVFEQADAYGSVEQLSKESYEDAMMNLFDLLVEAQEREKPVAEIIGEDWNQFCKNYFQKEDSRERMASIPARIATIMKILLVVEIFDIFLVEEGHDIVKMQSNIFPLVLGIMIGAVISIICKMVLKPLVLKKKIKPIVVSFIIIFIWIGLVAIGVITLGNQNVSMPVLPLLILSVGYLLVYYVMRLARRYFTTGTMRTVDWEEKKAKKVFQKELDHADTYQTVLNNMAKQYDSINTKKVKKGQPLMPMEAYTKKLMRGMKYEWVIDLVALLFFVAIVLMPIIEDLTNGRIADAILMGTILAVVEGAIYRFFYRIIHDNSEARAQILKECEELGITVCELQEKRNGSFL